MAFTALATVLLGMPVPAMAQAQVKSGVEAWQRGEYAVAVAAWRGPALAGDADAQFNLGQAYKLGRGVTADAALAEEWFRKAAMQGHPQAEVNYGLALFENNKRTTALPWLEKSASRGEPRAQYVLGIMLYNGDGVEKDWVRAYALIARATAQGLPQAARAQGQMDGFISLTERQKALELARQYELDEGRTYVAAAPPTKGPTKGTPPRPIGRTDVPPSTAYRPPEPAPMDSASVAEAQPGPPIVRPAKRPTSPSAAADKPAPVRDGGWRAQLGAFGDAANARRVGAKAGGKFPGRRIYYVKAGRLTRVLVGPFASSAEASAACRGVSPCVPVRD